MPGESPIKLACEVPNFFGIDLLQVQIAICLHNLGGSASTKKLHQQTGIPLTTLKRKLAALEQNSLVVPQIPPGRRYGRTLIWRLDLDTIQKGLMSLTAALLR